MKRFLSACPGMYSCAQAGAIIRTTFRTGIVDKVKTETDPVTETDLACEAAVKAILEKAFPTHAFLGLLSSTSEFISPVGATCY
jgi:fructose-1,6-bisphosphatase/inositol monophosphatase family enzyme